MLQVRKPTAAHSECFFGASSRASARLCIHRVRTDYAGLIGNHPHTPMLRTVLFATVMAAAAGCAQVAQYRSELDPSTACLARTFHGSEAEVLSTKTVLRPTDRPTTDMLADRSHATAAERSALGRLILASDRCRALGEEYRSGVLHPKIVQAQERVHVERRLLIARLYTGMITWGEFNTTTLQVNEFVSSNMTSARHRITVAEAAERKAAAEAFLRSMAKIYTPPVVP